MLVVSTSWYTFNLVSSLMLTFFPFFLFYLLFLLFLSPRSMPLLLASIVSDIWFNGSGNKPSSPVQPSATVALGPWLALMGLLVVGMIYLVMIMKTLMRYGKEQGEMRVDAEMSLGAVPVQSGEPEDRGRETEMGTHKQIS